MAYQSLCFVFCDFPFPNLFLTSLAYNIFFSLIHRIPIDIINLLYVKYKTNKFPVAGIYILLVHMACRLYKGFYWSHSQIYLLFLWWILGLVHSRFGSYFPISRYKTILLNFLLVFFFPPSSVWCQPYVSVQTPRSQVINHTGEEHKFQSLLLCFTFWLHLLLTI